MIDQQMASPMIPQEAPQGQPSPMTAMAQQAQGGGQEAQLNLNDPRLDKLINPVLQEIQDSGVSVDEISQFVNLLKFAMEHPDAYPQIRQQLIAGGTLDEGDLPEQFDAKYIAVLLISFKIVEKKLQEKGAEGSTPEVMMRKGGLARLAGQGRRGDTMLAHIGPAEDKILRSYGGSGAINPNTGLPEYGFFKSIAKVVKAVAPVAIPIMMVALPGVGTAIGTALGASGLTASIVGGSVLGGGLSAITGGNVLQGAVFGGLAGGLAPAVGSGVSSALGLNLGTTAQAALGGALVGGGVGYAQTGTAQGALKGATIGGLSSGAGSAAAGAAGTGTALATGLGSAANVAGASLTAGYDPKQALINAATSGVFAGGMSAYNGAPSGFTNANGEYIANPDAAAQQAQSIGNVANATDLPTISMGNAPQFDYTANIPSNADGSLGLSYQQGVGIPAPAEIGTTPYGFDDYASQAQIDAGTANPSELTPADIQAAHESTLTKYANGLGASPGTVMADANGRFGEVTFDKATGNAGFAPYQGQYVVNPETNAVEWQTAEPSMMDKFKAGFTGEEYKPPLATGTTSSATPDTGTPWGKYALYGGAGLLGLQAMSKSSVPQEVQAEVSQLPASQQEYFSRPYVVWDWNKMQADAAANNQTLSQYMARNWNNITSGQYNMPTATTATAAAARGGALSDIAHYVRGGGTGRSDSIDAKLSDGEYVIDAETVALLGDGSNKAGARILDNLREEIRRQKGKALAKGKISPNAKAPLAYLKGAM